MNLLYSDSPRTNYKSCSRCHFFESPSLSLPHNLFPSEVGIKHNFIDLCWELEEILNTFSTSYVGKPKLDGLIPSLAMEILAGEKGYATDRSS